MKNKNSPIKKKFFIVFVVVLFTVSLIQATSEGELVKYGDLEKEEIGDDDESQGALREYYGEMLGKVKKDAKFNTIATSGDIAVFNVTINGKDTRILTRLREATLSSGQPVDLTNAKLIRTENLIVLGNISLKGILFSEVDNIFGSRRLFGVESTGLRYVDEGFARLANGKANVSINPILRELISDYNVFLSAEGLTRGIYVAEKTNAYFVVKSVNANSNVGFSWMLRGVRKGFDEKLESYYGREKGISITATINFENGSTYVKITGLDKILELANETQNNLVDNNSNNGNNSNNQFNETNNNQSLRLITGNLVDEFGLETDLGQILGDATPLPNLSETSDETISNITEETINQTITPYTGLDNITFNETISGNESIVQEPSVLEFALYSTNEDYIVEQVSFVTGLNVGQVRKLISFVYLEPESFEDEAREEQLSLDFMEKVDGSVIIRLG